MMCRSVAGSSSFSSQRDVVPERRPDEHIARGVGLAHHGQRLDEQVIPVRIHGLAGLIEQFEHHVRWRVLVALRHLRPEGQDMLAAALGILATVFVVVLVEDDVQALLHCLVHQAVQRGVPALGQLQLRVHRAEAVQVDPHGIETAVLDDLEVPQLEAATRRVFPQRVVAHDVHPAPHRLDLVGGAQGRVRGRRQRGSGHQQGNQQRAERHL